MLHTKCCENVGMWTCTLSLVFQRTYLGCRYEVSAGLSANWMSLEKNKKDCSHLEQVGKLF